MKTIKIHTINMNILKIKKTAPKSLNNIVKFSKLTLSLFAILSFANSLQIVHALDTGSADSATVGVQQARGLSDAFNSVAEKITPSVVSISTFKKAKPIKGLGKGNNQLNDPFFNHFKEFFGEDFLERFPQGGQGGQEAPQQGMGTGVIVDPRGYILTNNHVIGEADEVEVTMKGESKKLKAEIIGKDPKSDLAVVKIQPTEKLVVASLGDSSNLRIGDWVVAAGNPFGLDNTITAGIVSAKGRSLGNIGQYEDFIQTDAAINPGNSGGPLCDLNGDVVGINTAIFTRSGGYMGVGFAIPSNMVKSVMESLISKGKVVRGWLGVGIQNLSEDLASSLNYKNTEGALVGQIQNDSPAEKAGIQQEDIITSFNGEKVKDMNQLRNKVADTPPGTQAEVVIFRNGKEMTIPVKIEELTSQSIEEEEVDEVEETVAGISVDTITAEIADKLRIKKNKGVIVTNVAPNSIAQQAGIQPRDVIVSINGKPVNKKSEFYAMLTKEALKKGVRLLVGTQNMERFVFLKSEE